MAELRVMRSTTVTLAGQCVALGQLDAVVSSLRAQFSDDASVEISTDRPDRPGELGMLRLSIRDDQATL